MKLNVTIYPKHSQLIQLKELVEEYDERFGINLLKSNKILDDGADNLLNQVFAKYPNVNIPKIAEKMNVSPGWLYYNLIHGRKSVLTVLRGNYQKKTRNRLKVS
jgi:hypothetical protein